MTDPGPPTLPQHGPPDPQQLERLRGARRVVLSTHKGPDADGLGTQVALARALRALGVDVRIINSDALPGRLSFMDPEGSITRWRELPDGPAALDDADLIVIVDVADIERTGDMEQALRERAHKVMALDHHLDDGSGCIGIVDPDVSSCGELAWRLMGWLGAPIDEITAAALYTSISYDTGSFRWLRNQPQTLRVAADLIERGADAAAIQESLWGARPRDHARLIARATEAAHWEADGRLGWVIIDNHLKRGLTVDREAYREVISHLLGIDGALVAATFQVEGKGTARVRMSLRSKRAVEVVEVARRYGGGGHAHACGATAEKVRPAELVREVLDGLLALLPPA